MLGRGHIVEHFVGSIQGGSFPSADISRLMQAYLPWLKDQFCASYYPFTKRVIAERISGVLQKNESHEWISPDKAMGFVGYSGSIDLLLSMKEKVSQSHSPTDSLDLFANSLMDLLVEFPHSIPPDALSAILQEIIQKGLSKRSQLFLNMKALLRSTGVPLNEEVSKLLHQLKSEKLEKFPTIDSFNRIVSIFRAIIPASPGASLLTNHCLNHLREVVCNNSLDEVTKDSIRREFATIVQEIFDDIRSDRRSYDPASALPLMRCAACLGGISQVSEMYFFFFMERPVGHFLSRMAEVTAWINCLGDALSINGCHLRLCDVEAINQWILSEVDSIGSKPDKKLEYELNKFNELVDSVKFQIKNCGQ